MSRRVARIVAALAIGVATATTAGSAAAAPPVPNDSSRLALLAQDAWTPLGGTFHARLQIGVNTSGVQLSVIAHAALNARGTFDDSVADRQLGPVLAQVLLPVDALPASSDGGRSVSVGLAKPNGAFDPSRLAVHRSGVYPLEVELRDRQDQSLARFVTYLVVVDANADGSAQPLNTKLGVAWVWPLAARPAMRPDGSVEASVAAAFQPDGRLGRQVAALAADADVPVTLAPAPETLDAWSAAARTDPGAAQGVTGLRGAAGRDQVLAGPYVPVDLPALLRAGLGGAADAQFVQGGVSLDRFFGAHIDTRVALAEPVDPDSLGRLRSHGVDHVVVNEASVGAPRSKFTVASPFSVEPSPTLAPTGPLGAVVNDARLASLLVGNDPPALRAQRFLAGLALVAVEQPATTRAVVAVNPDGLDPPSTLLDAVLTGLRNHPWVAPTTLGQVFSGVPAAPGNPVRPLDPVIPSSPPVSARTYQAADTHLAAFGSLVGPTDARVARAERFLLSSLSTAWPAPDAAASARAELHAVDRTINDFLLRIRVPAPGTITLTSRSGAIPITFRNDTGLPVRVLVALQSRKLDFPSGAVQTVALPTRSTTIRFEVRSRTSGTFPLEMSIRSADGSLLIAQGRFKVRSTVVSTVGLALAAGAALFLAAWWIFDIRRRRQARAAAGS